MCIFLIYSSLILYLAKYKTKKPIRTRGSELSSVLSYVLLLKSSVSNDWVSAPAPEMAVIQRSLWLLSRFTTVRKNKHLMPIDFLSHPHKQNPLYGINTHLLSAAVRQNRHDHVKVIT